MDQGLWREGDYWAVCHGGAEVRLKSSKGLEYLATLLAHPGAELHVLELAAPEATVAESAAPVLDEQAKSEYRARVQGLREELEEARTWNDDERAARAQEELDFIGRELAQAVGLGGRDRPAASQAERARQSVGRAIRKAVRHIADELPQLGVHLERAVKTGAFCTYSPEPENPFPLLAGPPTTPGRRADAPSTNLPLQLTTFVGREHELEEIGALLTDARLVTLTGAGGTGKTRLALELAARRAEDLSGGAWLVDLAPVADPGLVIKAFAQALGVRERPDTPLRDDVLARVRDAEMLLLVVDNCEHLVDESARVAQDLLQEAANLRVLATSREPLGIPGEVVFRTASLPDPDAVALFTDRARDAQPGVDFEGESEPLVTQLCRRLDGLPLAIELAAARTASFSLADLAAHLDDRFTLLTGGARTALPRQRTLEATVAWSYDLLDDRHRTLFDSLSVFVGGWTVDAAADVCASCGMERREVLAGLGTLVDKSLVVRDEARDGVVRYRLLETLRQYGRDRLQETGRAKEVRDAHLDWMVAFAQQVEPGLSGLAQARCLDLLETELDNTRAALEWSLASGNPEAGLKIASISVAGFWLWRGHMREAQPMMERLLAAPGDVSDAVRAAGLLAAGRLCFQSGVWEEGTRLCTASLEIARATGDTVAQAAAYLWLVINAWGVHVGGGITEAELSGLIEDGIEVARRSEDPLMVGLTVALCALWWVDRDVDRAWAMLEEAAVLIDQIPAPNWQAHIWEFRAIGAEARGDLHVARECLAKALPLYHQMDNRNCGAHCLETTAGLVARMGEAEAGSELLGTAERLREVLGGAAPAYEAFVRARSEAMVGASLDDDTREAARERGRSLAFEAAMARALEHIS